MQQIVAQGCRYGNEALAQVMQAQVSPATLYANTPDVGYLVEIEQVTEASLTSFGHNQRNGLETHQQCERRGMQWNPWAHRPYRL